MNSDIMIFPSFYKSEAFAVSIVEAMRAGNVIITTKQGYHHSIIKPENGVVIEHADVYCLESAINSLIIEKENLKEIQIINIAKAKTNYSLSKFKFSFHNIINELSCSF